MVVIGSSLTLISIVKPKRRRGSHIEKGWDPSAPAAPHRTRFGSHIDPSTHRACKAGGFDGAILGPKKVHASGFNISCLHNIIRIQSSCMLQSHVAADYVQAILV